MFICGVVIAHAHCSIDLLLILFHEHKRTVSAQDANQEAITMTSGMIENSHLIQVYSNTRTIWRGEEWSKLSFAIKVDKSFRTPEASFILRAIVENYGMEPKTVISPWESDKLKVEFEKHCTEQHSWNAHVVENDAFNTLLVDVHKDLFKDGEQIRVIVAAQSNEGQSRNMIFGASQPIS